MLGFFQEICLAQGGGGGLTHKEYYVGQVKISGNTGDH